MEEFEGLFIDFHVFAEGNRRCLRPSDEMAPAPRFARGVKLLHDGLMMLEGMHLGEVIVAGDLRQPR